MLLHLDHVLVDIRRHDVIDQSVGFCEAELALLPRCRIYEVVVEHSEYNNKLLKWESVYIQPNGKNEKVIGNGVIIWDGIVEHEHVTQLLDHESNV